MAKYRPSNDPTSENKTRIRSVRGYRRMADRILYLAATGQMDPRHAASLVNGIKASAEMFMAETMLARAGQDSEHKAHQLGEDGGLKGVSFKTWRRKKVKATTGTDRFGARIDNKSVEIETSADDDKAENDAEAATL